MTQKEPAMQIFKMPVPVTIMGRSSGITNSFVNGIIPCIEPTADEIDDALYVLGMTRESICCAYCGDKHTEWDHLNPLIIDKNPTGYISEIHNLVPVCNKCNQSKGNHNWKEWMIGDAKLSPKTREIADLSERIARLETYEERFIPVRIDFIELVGQEAWEDYWAHYEKVIETMREAQLTANVIRDKVRLELGLINNPKTQKRTGRYLATRRANDPLPITLVPSEQYEFERSLLQHRKAIIEIHYADGRIEKKPWKAYKFQESSDVYNNLRTRNEFRPGVWQASGIDHIVARVETGI